jgi:peptide/nickel transport system substrate-binding protein
MSPHRLRRRRPVALASTALLGLLLTACSSGAGSSDATSSASADAQPVAGGTYVHALEGDPLGCLDAPQQRYHVALNITRQLADSLVDQDPKTGEIVPWLAKTWEISDDAQTFTFHLVEGATFSDGLPIDAAAVKANLDRIVALGPKAVGAGPWIQGYVGTTVVDPQTVTIAFDRPNVQFLQALSGSWFGLISPADTGKTPEELCTGTYAGSGPFTLTSYTKDQDAVLAKRAGYDWPSSLATHQGEAYLDTLKFTFVPEAGVRSGSVTSNQVQSASLISWQDEATLTAAGDTLLTAHQPGLTESWIPNQQSWLAADEPVRQAIRYAINSQEIVDTVYGPTYQSRTAPLNSTTPGYTDLSTDLTFDPDRAKELLDDDGWKVGADGIREKDGKRLTINVIASYTDLEIIQQQLKDVGIDYPIRQLDPAASSKAVAAGDYDIYAWTMTRADPTVLNALYSSTWTSLGYAKANPSELDALLATQESTVDPGERATAAAAVQKYVVDNAWNIPIADRAWTYGIGPSSHGLRLDGETKLVFYDAWVQQ